MSTFSDLTLLLLQYAFLLVLWLFVFTVVFSLRADIFGVRVRKLPASAVPTTPPGGAAAAPTPVPAGGPASTGAVNRIVITSGPKAGLEVPLGREALTIGRSSESGLVIRDDYTSSHHARLVLWGEQWMLQDLESTNGTFLDGERVSPNAPVAVHAGVPVKVGATTFELRK